MCDCLLHIEVTCVEKRLNSFSKTSAGSQRAILTSDCENASFIQLVNISDNKQLKLLPPSQGAAVIKGR